ncbi:hypothetical protein K3725_01205 [Leisingera sp. S132]|uniref:hypothetical protein n=1 Tax=Leisingera sp. S132 TaxID=2867016 RepID=UPI0021A2AE03|nr:hypothetical protein [Leisingera sp. S132]UWQ79658.1 hypothetical protein K3725_01205 [Leisingera sp. S132]
MALKKAIGILVFSIQGVVGYDYYIQTRDAGLNWGDLSATDYGTIVQDRVARSRAARDSAALDAPQDSQSLWQTASSYGKSLLGGGAQVAQADTAGDAGEAQSVCIRRGNVADC